jgi:glutamate dehydrogenase (NAD(P)+)
MNWMKDTYVTAYGHRDVYANGVVTGKSIGQAGIVGRTESTGLGAYFAIRELLNDPTICKKLGVTKGLKGKKFTV